MKKRILITTGIYPPQIGGPAQYAVMLEYGLRIAGYQVSVKSFGSLLKFPVGLRHILYFLKILPAVVQSDMVISLDTFSAALPSVWATTLCHKRLIVRVGGDFLWEKYLDRVRQPILLSEFYTKERNLSGYEQKIFDLTKYIFRKAHTIVFSTEWQKNIMVKAYDITSDKVVIIENEYEQLEKRHIVPKQKVILSPARDRYLKNKSSLEQAMQIVHERFSDMKYDTNVSTHEELLARIAECYILVVPSVSEVSPNIVIEAVTHGVPVICSADCGIRDRLGDRVFWVDTRKPEAIAEAIVELQDATLYAEYMARLSKFDFVHTAQDIVKQFELIIDHI